MKKLLKLLATALAAVFVFTAAGCKDNTPDPDGGKPTIGETSVTLAQNGATEYAAVIPAAATEAEKYAAEQLALYFKQATGAALAIKTDAGMSFDKNAKVISVGRTAIFTGSGLTLDQKTLTYDGFRIERFENTVILCGVGDSGTIYAVQDFLNLQFAYEAYAADEVYIETKTDAKLLDFHYSDSPDFEGRDMDGDLLYNRSAATMLRIRSWNNDAAAYAYGASRDWIGGHCESFLHVLPKEIYNDEEGHPDTYHPEWYSHSAKQMCLTNAELIDEFVKNMIALIEENPYGRYVNIAEEDHGGMCGCATCKKEQTDYLVSGYVIRFCNAVIDAIEEWRLENCPERELKYVTFAYSSGSINPPVKDLGNGTFAARDESVVPHEKLYMRITPIQYCYSHAFMDESCSVNKTFRTQLAGWRAITDRFMIYDYDANYAHYYLFFNDYESLAANARLYKEMGVVNVFRQNCTGSRIRSMVDLNNYLNGKLLWNAELETETLIDDFMDHFYKSGAPYMKQYLAMMRSYLKQRDIDSLASGGKGLHFQLYDTYQPQLATSATWEKRILEQAMELFDKASATYDSIENEGEREMMKKRVLKESFCIRYLIIKNYSSYYNQNSSAYADMVKQYREDAATLGAFSHAEGQDLSAWLDSLI